MPLCSPLAAAIIWVSSAAPSAAAHGHTAGLVHPAIPAAGCDMSPASPATLAHGLRAEAELWRQPFSLLAARTTRASPAVSSSPDARSGGITRAKRLEWGSFTECWDTDTEHHTALPALEARGPRSSLWRRVRVLPQRPKVEQSPHGGL